MSDIVAEVYAYEVLHVTQAMDMRVRHEGRKLGEGTAALLKDYRKVVPYVDADRIFTHDLNRTYAWIKGFGVKH